MTEKPQLSADERDCIHYQVESDRWQGFILDAAAIAIGNHKALMESAKQALAVRKPSL
jgi:hypothetical protein